MLYHPFPSNLLSQQLQMYIFKSSLRMLGSGLKEIQNLTHADLTLPSLSLWDS
jgi:hypothetical protein